MSLLVRVIEPTLIVILFGWYGLSSQLGNRQGV